VSAGAAGRIPPLRPVSLQELRLRSDALAWSVDQKLADLDSLTPVRGQLWARHHGSVLEVEGEAETIVTLCCDRCLQHFNRPLRAAVHELLDLAGGDELEGTDLTALAASAASPGAPRARFRPTGPGAGTSGASAPGGRAAGRPPAAGRDRGRRDPAVGADLAPSHASGQGQPRGSRSRSQAEPLLIEVLDDRLDPRGAFDPERWLFEQLSLQLPVVNRCGADCPGPPQAPEGPDNGHPEEPVFRQGSTGHQPDPSTSQTPNSASPNASDPEPPIDPRWAALRQLLP